MKCMITKPSSKRGQEERLNFPFGELALVSRFNHPLRNFNIQQAAISYSDMEIQPII